MSDRVGIYLFALSLTSVLVPKVVGSFISAKPNEHQQRVACISAPGKVLIAGGYLVLEHPNLGVSVATSSRFFTTVLPKEMQDGIPTFPSCITIVVESPQFYEQYIYTYNTISGQVSSRGSNSNEFVEKCISLTMAFVKEFKQKDGSGLGPILNSLSGTHYLSVILQAHNDFYSQIKEVINLTLYLKFDEAMDCLTIYCFTAEETSTASSVLISSTTSQLHAMS